ncbi:MAG: DUF2207 domain-containing protein [Flavobacteriales bacterium]|nr:DUF2207 domain-containing protein [Flavobacteriales bacterium]
MPIIGGIITLLLLLYYIVTWIRFGRDPDLPTVIPLFEPPDAMSPASVGMVMEESSELPDRPATDGPCREGTIRIDERKRNSYWA